MIQQRFNLWLCWWSFILTGLRKSNGMSHVMILHKTFSLRIFMHNACASRSTTARAASYRNLRRSLIQAAVKCFVTLWSVYGEVLSAPCSNPQAGGPSLVDGPRLFIQYIRSYAPYWRPFLHPQPEEAPCRGYVVVGSPSNSHATARLACTNVPNARYSLLDGATDGGQVIVRNM